LASSEDQDEQDGNDRDDDGKKKKRGRKKWLFLAVAVIAVAVVVVLLVTSGDDKKSRVGPKEAKFTQSRFQGIGQSGPELGNVQAKVTLYEYADLQRVPCREYGEQVLPRLLERYVRPGKVKVVWRTMTFIGPDSITAARAAVAAGAQNRLWDFVDLFQKNARGENTGYVTDKFLQDIALGIAIDPAMLGTDERAAFVEEELGRGQSEAAQFHLKTSPSFLVQVGKQRPRRIATDGCSFGQISGPLDKALARAGGT
jgi:protein-disulfide isomerase